MTRPVARIGDADIVHCSPMVRAMGAPNVLVNGRPASCLGDLNTVHKFPAGKKCLPHAEPIFKGGPTVFCNGRPIGHIGDKTCTAVALGSESVLAN